MRIDRQGRRQVRSVLRRVIAKDIREFWAALIEGDPNPRDDEAWALAVDMCAVAFGDRYETASDAQIHAAAIELADMAQWIGLTVEEVLRFLSGLGITPPREMVQTTSDIGLPYVIAGTIAAAQATELGIKWYIYMDRVERIVEIEREKLGML